MQRHSVPMLLLSSLFVVAVAPALGEKPLGTAFTHQGQLKQGGAPAQPVSDEEDTEIADLIGRLARMERIVEQLVSKKEREKA